MRGRVLKLLLASTILIGGAVTVKEEVYAKTNDNLIKSSVLLSENTQLQNGKYKVSVKTLKEGSDEMSMAGQYVDQTATLDVSNGKKYLSVGISRSDWMKNIKVTVNGSATSFKLINKGGNNAVVKFQIPNEKSKIKFSMNVVPMGNANVSFRVVLGDKFTKIGSNATNTNSTSNKVEAKKTSTQTQNTVNAKETNNTATVQQNNDSKDLPETGSKIPVAGVIGFGAVAAIAGAVLIKKKM